ncbi:MAG: hypothetical protein LBQ50_09730 [Planctomycetaceae bacterium]|jgi:hypothetical protein|nr:hypothetical protein [Planctomycetaceae bacterium]
MPENQLLNTTTLTFDQMMALFKETSAQMQENRAQMQETDRRMKETDQQIKETKQFIKETDQQLREYIREAEKDRKKLSEQMGYLGNRFGELAEHLVAPGIAERFNQLGYNFNRCSPSGVTISDAESKKIIAEIDLLLENHETIAVVEIKAKPRPEDIENHIKRIEIYRQDREKSGEKRKKIIGAIAGAIFPDKEKSATLEAGLFVITQSGDTIRIDVPENFQPRIF